MLKSLTLKNFAIIEELKTDFGPGLNVFTGETGAGKSILIEALGFALGDRSSQEMIRAGAPKTEVAASFACKLPKDLGARLGISGQEFTVRRELDIKGRGRAFINERPVPVSMLAELGDALVDFHGQHEHQTLLKPQVQLDLLDRFGKLDKEAGKTAETFHRRASLLARQSAQKLSAEEKERLLDLYSYQLKEIEDAALKEGEDEEIEMALPRLKNAGKLKESAEQAYGLISSGEASALEQAGKAGKLGQELAALDPAISGAGEQIAQALSLLEDAAKTLSDYKDSIDIDPAQLDSMLSRQDKLARLKKKYGATIQDILLKAETLRGKISDLDSADRKEEELEAELAQADAEYRELCSALHEKRMTAAERLSKAVLTEIKPLGFPEIRFSVSVELEEDKYSASGADNIEFLFSANPGQPLKPLKNIISGGEMSRVMLGLKTVLAGADSVPVLVFDEVDSGIGGAVGRMVGLKLAALGKNRQVLCVTHLAQVAACGDRHFTVSKTAAGKKTQVSVSRLEQESRTAELARMLAGNSDASSAGFRHAEELLDDCKAAVNTSGRKNGRKR